MNGTKNAALRLHSAAPHITWPAISNADARGLLSLLFQFEQTQWWSAAELAARQYQQLATLIAFALARVPYYRERLAGLAWRPGEPLTPALFAQIPLLRRADIEQHGDALLTPSFVDHGNIRRQRTSGSSSRALEFAGTEVTGLFWSALTLRDHLWQRHDVSRSMATIRSGRWASDPFAVVDHPSWGHPTATVYETGPLSMMYHRQPIARQAEILVARKPGYILTYPSNLVELAEYFARNDLDLPNLAAVMTYGEPVTEDVRRLCREQWNVAVSDAYSCEEVGYIAFQCPQQAGYHVQAESVLVEVLDGDDRPCAPGEYGRVVISALHNFAFPMIRYEIGDIAEAGASCGCGRGLPVLGSIPGRIRNMGVLEDGQYFVPNVSRATWRHLQRITRCQFVQRTLSDIEIKVAVTRPLSAGDKQTLISNVGRAFPPRFKFVVSEHAELPRHANGKFETFIGEVPPLDNKPPRFVRSDWEANG